IDAAEPDPSQLWCEDAIDQIEERRLAGTVRPDEAENFAALDGEAQLAHRLHAAETLADLIHLQKSRHSSTRCVRANRLYIQPMSPLGKKRTVIRRSTPAITSWKCEKASEVRRNPRSSS